LSWVGTLKLYIGAPIGGQELFEGLGTELGLEGLGCIAQLFTRAGSHQGSGREMSDGIGCQVAIDHFDVWLSGLPSGYDLTAQLARGRVVTQDARIDVQQFHEVLLRKGVEAGDV